MVIQNMPNMLKVWLEVMKLGRVMSLSKEVNAFYRKTVLDARREVGGVITLTPT
jgi:hypothetical protein